MSPASNRWDKPSRLPKISKPNSFSSSEISGIVGQHFFPSQSSAFFDSLPVISKRHAYKFRGAHNKPLMLYIAVVTLKTTLDHPVLDTP
jgi:hypothetical protein